MAHFDFKTQQATLEWLTSVLLNNGFLSDGHVAAIEQTTEDYPGIASHYHSLKVTYSQGSVGHLPTSMILKVNKLESYDEVLHEVDFYNELADKETPLPLVTCYGTDKSLEAGQCCLLLNDLSHSHQQTEWPLTPHYEQCKQAVTALATMHAHWWNSPHFTKPIFEAPSAEGKYQWIEEQLPLFIDFLGERLSEQRVTTLKAVFKTLPSLMWSRLCNPNRRTLIHGDAHYWNFLYPRNSEQDECILIDWAGWDIGLATDDLAYMIALHEYPERRQNIEQPLLRLYLETLHKQGVAYTWDELWADYQISVLGILLVPIAFHAQGIPPEYWWSRLERGFAAFDDLNCKALLGHCL